MEVIVNMQEAQAQFSELLAQAHAGQEIIVAKAGKPYARLMPLPLTAAPAQRKPGRLTGQLSERFFEPLTEEDLTAWEG